LFQRASYVNQARVHNGYHYPRSLYTALQSAHYYDRFNRDFAFAIHNQFDKIYATSKHFSYTNADSFVQFCKAARIPCQSTDAALYFKENQVDGCFLCQENTMDARKIALYYTQQFAENPRIDLYLNARLQQVQTVGANWEIQVKTQEFSGVFHAPWVLNTTYASTNALNMQFALDTLPLKYELTEMVICDVPERFQRMGITVMDGAFFSLMPFGLTGSHSLSAVNFTPHENCREVLPNFSCQANRLDCNPAQLQCCLTCAQVPKSNFENMKQLAHKYLLDDMIITPKKSIFAVKTILNTTEISDSRPTIIRTLHQKPDYISVLSGKFNTIYDLDDIL
jgi:hypothetical protein